jgi:putative DNA primase/helicase
LQDEAAGILAWAVRGCIAWQQVGLNIPDCIRTATQAYRNDMDVVGQYLDEMCVTAPHWTIRKMSLFEAYEAWCRQREEEPLKFKAFNSRIAERGYKGTLNAKSQAEWCGISLASDRSILAETTSSPYRAGF